MRAVQIVAPRQIELVELPMPSMGPGQVLTRTALASICGSDWPVALFGRPDVTYPLDVGRPCHEIVSIVEASDVPELRPGDRVLSVAYDGFREYHVRRPEELLKLPNDLPLEQVMMSQPLGVVLRMCRRWPSVLGWKVVVIGQGTIGLLFTAMLERLGASLIIALDLEDGRLAVGRTMGASHSVNPSKEDPVAAVMDLAGGKGADMVVEAAGEEATVNMLAPMVRQRGYLTLFGFAKKSPVPLDLISLVRREVILLTAVAGDRDEDYGLARDLIAAGRISIPRLITHLLPIAEVRRGFEMAHDRPDGMIKVGLQFDA